MTAKLPADKRTELIELLEEWATKRTCKLKEIQSLLGKLNHACTVVPHGRTFLRRLLDLLKGHPCKQSRFIRPNNECKLDIEWWRSLLPTWDGVYFLIYLTGPPFLTCYFRLMHRVAEGMGHSTQANGSMALGPLVNSH